MPGPSSLTPSWTTPSTSAQSIVIVVSGGAYLTAFSTRCSRIWRSRGGSARACSRTRRPRRRPGGRPRSGRSEADDLVDDGLDVDRRDAGGPLGHDADRGEDRVDEAVEPLDLLERGAVPRGARLAARDVARLAADERRLLGEQVGVGADDGQRRPQLVRDERDQLAARLVDRLERLDPGLGLGLLAALLDDARRAGRRPHRAGRRRESLKSRGSLGLDVEDADDLVVPRSAARDSIEATNRRWSMPRTHRKRGSALTSGMTSGSLRRGDAAGHALAERHPRPADLEAVEAVRRGERQVRSVAVQQVERGDVRVERVAGPVDDRLEQLVPGPRGRRQAQRPRGGTAAARAGPAARASGAAGASPGRRLGRATPSRVGRHGHHHTSVGKVAAGKVAAGARLRSGTVRKVGRRERLAAPPALGGGRRRAGRDRHGRRAATRSPPRSGCSARCSARSSPSRPAPSCSSSSSASGGGRSPCAATTIPSERAPARRGAARRSTSGRAEAVIGAFALYFQLVNLAEARGRVRALRRRERAARDGVLDDSVAEASPRSAAPAGPTPSSTRCVGRLSVTLGADRAPDRGPPADRARRAASLRRAARAARRPAPDPVRGPRGPPPAARGDHAPVADVGPARRSPRRRSTRSGPRWRSSTRRCSRSCPGCTGRSTRAARSAGVAARRRRRHRLGADRHAAAAGRPVPALGQLDRRRPGRQPGRDRRDHRADAADPRRPRPARLRGGRDPADADDRAAAASRERVLAARWRHASRATPRTLPETDRQLRRRFPDEPYRQRFGFIAERLRRTRAALTGEAAPLTGRYASPDGARRRARRAPGGARRRRPRAGRVGRGRRPALAARDVRVPPRVARGPPARRRPPGGARAARPRRTRRPRHRGREVSPGVTLDEVTRHVPGDRRDPGAVRRRGLPPLRRELHRVGERT